MSSYEYVENLAAGAPTVISGTVVLLFSDLVQLDPEWGRSQTARQGDPLIRMGQLDFINLVFDHDATGPNGALAPVAPAHAPIQFAAAPATATTDESAAPPVPTTQMSIAARVPPVAAQPAATAQASTGMEGTFADREAAITHAKTYAMANGYHLICENVGPAPRRMTSLRCDWGQGLVGPKVFVCPLRVNVFLAGIDQYDVRYKERNHDHSSTQVEKARDKNTKLKNGRLERLAREGLAAGNGATA